MAAEVVKGCPVHSRGNCRRPERTNHHIAWSTRKRMGQGYASLYGWPVYPLRSPVDGRSRHGALTGYSRRRSRHPESNPALTSGDLSTREGESSRGLRLFGSHSEADAT